MDSDEHNFMDGLSCPNCGQSIALDVETDALIRLTREDLELLNNAYTLFDDAKAQCPDCKYIAEFQEFKVEHQFDSLPTTPQSMHSKRTH
jgi:hypothetical protein